MGSRADVLGALLEGSVAEAQVRSQRTVAGEVAAERRKLQSGPSAASFNAKHPRGGKGTAQGGKFVAKGSSGTPVKRVQAKLGVTQTGSFGFDTVAAVENYQRAHGLQVDGVVGAQTAQSLLGNRNAKTVTPGALSAADRKALGVGASKAKVRKPSAPNRIGGGISA